MFDFQNDCIGLNHSHLVAEEATRNVNLLTPHNDNLLPAQNLLGDNGCKPAQKMALAINDDGARGEGGHGCLVESRVSLRIRSFWEL